ncbi:MAG TPA: protein kinase [Kofleriaceae bacterium]|nr:protein kinase [Kofleriaceae bacterium]
MPGCPQCGRHWPDSYSRCPDDGTALIPALGVPTGSGAAPELAYPSSDEDLPNGSLAGEYRIEKKIGEGGMGAVYGAKHPLIGKRAAIKVIRRELSSSREAVDRFVLEAQSVNQIGHPNIVDVFGFGQLPDGRSFFVMEWLQGESLRERLQRPLQFPEAIEFLEQIAKALHAAHEAGVVHRDLKPDNVFLESLKGEKPQVKLLDFGLAKLTGSDSQRSDRTRTGVVMGTPLYLSPEQAKGAKIDASTDVYSLGAMAYEMLAGVVPFKADSAVEIMAMHISQRAIPLMQIAPWVPLDINNLVHTMLEKDPRQRPTAAQVRERLAACRSTAGAVTIGVAMAPSSQSPSSQPHWTPQVPQSAPPGVMQQPGSQPPMMAHAAMAQSGMAQPSGSKKMITILALLALIGAGLGVVLYIAFGKKQTTPANEQPSKVEVPSTEPAKTEPAKTEPATDPATTEPAKPEPAKTEPAADPTTAEPAKTEPAKTEPAKTEPALKTIAKPKGKVNVTFEGPAKAMIVVDGKPYGRETDGRVTIELPAGDHTVRVQAKGYKAADTKVRVDAGGSRDVKLTLEKKKTSTNSVHDPFAD